MLVILVIGTIFLLITFFDIQYKIINSMIILQHSDKKNNILKMLLPIGISV